MQRAELASKIGGGGDAPPPGAGNAGTAVRFAGSRKFRRHLGEFFSMR